MKHKKGFTLIELLVVIAIIGLLASVILASLNSARAKAADANIKENLTQIRSQAELLLDTNSLPVSPNTGYAGLFDCGQGLGCPGYPAYQAALTTSGVCGLSICGQAVANEDGGGVDVSFWAAWVALKTIPGSMWCVDHTGYSGIRQEPQSGLPVVPFESCADIN